MIVAQRAREARHARLARLYPLPDVRLEARGLVLAERLRRSGIVLATPASFATLVLNMARIALYWSTPEIEAREIVVRAPTSAATRDRTTAERDALATTRRPPAS